MESLKLSLSGIDYALVVLYFLFVVSVGLITQKRAGKSRKNFFLSGQNLPWWLLGTSMVATTFSIGSPLLVAGWSREAGIGKNWEWWVFLFGQMFTTFFFAKLWRRTNVFNDAQFIDVRYSGKAAAFLRGFRALYMGFIMNMLVLGTGLIAVQKIGVILLGIGPSDPNYEAWKWGITIVCGMVALSYTTMSGFAAIVITDFVGFIVAMTGAILIAVFAVKHPAVGGMSGLISQLQATMPERLEFIPSFGAAKAGMMSLTTVIVFCAVRWWAQIYGGAEPGGASHVVQRMLSAKSEKDALLGTMWFNIAHYVIRPLPWIIAGLATILIFPLSQYPDHEKVYLAAVDFLPIGFKGIAVASLFAAFLTNTDTRLNLGASYFINDFYKPFIFPDKSEHHYVIASKVITVVQMIASYSIFVLANDIRTLFFVYVGIGSGAGLVYILRFYWWRISAWSEIAAMTSALVCMVIFRWGVYGSEQEFNANAFNYMFISLGIVTASWLLVTFLTRPTDTEKLKEFFRKVRPGGMFWKPISTELAEKEGVRPDGDLWVAFIGWIFSGPMTLGYLFGLIYFFFDQPTKALICTAIGIACTYPPIWSIKKLTAKSDVVEVK
jgi:Na+/proline symporter